MFDNNFLKTYWPKFGPQQSLLHIIKLKKSMTGKKMESILLTPTTPLSKNN